MNRFPLDRFRPVEGYRPHRNDNFSHEATVTLDVAVLLHQIENNAFISAEAQTEADESKKAMLKDLAQEGNRMRSMQILDTAVQEVTEVLGGLTKRFSGELEALDNDDTDMKTVYVIRMRTPLTFPRTQLGTIRNQSVEYVISRVLNDWCLLVFPELAPVWESRMEDALDKIRKAMTVRIKPLRRKPSPF